VKYKFLFDACALIAFLNDEDGAEEVEKIPRNESHKNSLLRYHSIPEAV
jgi:PIN domain nuclease of toxin-antitoxin system